MIQELEVALPSKALDVELDEEEEEALHEEDLESEAETVDAEVEVEQRPDLRTGFLSRSVQGSSRTYHIDLVRVCSSFDWRLMDD